MKYVWIFIFSVSIHTFTHAQNTFTAKISVPAQIKEGEVFTANLTFNKPSDFHPYTVLTLQIPDGFFVDTKTVPNAETAFQNHILTITFIRLPGGKTLNIPLTISYIKGITGTFSLSGKLKYLVNNKNGEYNLKKTYFSIASNKKPISENLNRYNRTYETFQNIKCRRKINPQNNNTYLIELKLSGLPANNNFILTEEVSSGFTAENTGTQNSSVNPSGRIIQFKINNSADSKSIHLSYRLIPKIKKQKQNPTIFGKLSFIYKGQIITIPVEN